MGGLSSAQAMEVVEFHSVVEAVRAAIEVQTGIAERSAGLPADKRIEARVGIHLGDVVEEADGDLMGDSQYCRATSGDLQAWRDMPFRRRIPAGAR